MTAILKTFANFELRRNKGEFDLSSDTLKLMLLSSSYAVDLDVDDVKADIVGNEISGTGYTAGGKALTTVSLTLVPADSWSVARADSTAYALGDIIRPASGNGHLYRCIAAGTSHSAPPTFPTTPGDCVTETGGVAWAECGTAAVVLKADNVTWTTSTFTARYGVIYDDTHASDALIAYYDPGASLAPVAGSLLIPWPAAGILAFLTN